jgi:hypothetical protein
VTHVPDHVVNDSNEASRELSHLPGSSPLAEPADREPSPQTEGHVPEHDERAIILPTLEEQASPMWKCPECSYTAVGTVDEPLGDGTCPDHPHRLLQRARRTPLG